MARLIFMSIRVSRRWEESQELAQNMAAVSESSIKSTGSNDDANNIGDENGQQLLPTTMFTFHFSAYRSENKR